VLKCNFQSVPQACVLSLGRSQGQEGPGSGEPDKFISKYHSIRDSSNAPLACAISLSRPALPMEEAAIA